jgi:hypothetical protein
VTQSPCTVSKWLRRVREWSIRYLPAEIIGTLCALVCALAAFRLSTDRAAVAIVGTAAENIGFYGVMGILEWRSRIGTHSSGLVARTKRTLRTLVAEFGPAELLDSLILRPLCLYLALHLTHGAGVGSVVGKLMADGLFYGVAIVCREMIQRHTITGSWQGVQLT